MESSNPEGSLGDINLPEDYRYDDSKKVAVSPRLAGIIDFLNKEYGVYSHRKDFVNEGMRNEIDRVLKDINEEGAVSKVEIIDLLKLMGVVVPITIVATLILVLIILNLGVFV